jgi:site-specific recombinase XerD
MRAEKEKIYFEYLEECKIRGRSLKNIKYCLNIFYEYLNKNFSGGTLFLKIKDAESFQEYLILEKSDKKHPGKDNRARFTKASVLNIVGAVSSFYEYLKRRKLIYSNPFLEVERLKRNKALPRNILNEENMNKFLNNLKAFSKGKDITERKKLYKAHVIAELMYSTGARVNEIAKLKPEDIDFYRGVLTLEDSKTGKKREAILGSFAEKVLKVYIEEMRKYILLERGDIDKTLLFGAKTNLKPWLNEFLSKESNKSGLVKFTTHNFRHAVGFHLLRAGCDIRFIQEILGHHDLHSTEVYTKVEKEDLRNVIDKFHPRNRTEGRETEVRTPRLHSVQVPDVKNEEEE